MSLSWRLIVFVSILISIGAAGEQTCNEDGFCEASIVDEPEVVPKGANVDGAPREATADCIDRHPKECVEYSSWGLCEKTPGIEKLSVISEFTCSLKPVEILGWMIINCAKSCNACHLRDPKVRCARTALNMTLEPVYIPGIAVRLYLGFRFILT